MLTSDVLSTDDHSEPVLTDLPLHYHVLPIVATVTTTAAVILLVISVVLGLRVKRKKNDDEAIDGDTKPDEFRADCPPPYSEEEEHLEDLDADQDMRIRFSGLVELECEEEECGDCSFTSASQSLVNTVSENMIQSLRLPPTINLHLNQLHHAAGSLCSKQFSFAVKYEVLR